MEDSGLVNDYKESFESKIRWLMRLREFDIEQGKPSEPQNHPEIEKSLKERMGEEYEKVFVVIN
jgi:hypothetical protein